MVVWQSALLLLTTSAHVLAVPAPTPTPAPIADPEPEVTAPPTLVARDDDPTKVVGRNDVGSYVASVISSLGSAVPSFVASGIPQWWINLPTGTAVLSKLGIESSDLSAQPTQVLNLPSYANWTDHGWNLRLHGNVYKQPNISVDKLNDLANAFLIGTSIQDLPENEQENARNLTASIFVVQQGDVNVTMNLVNNVNAKPEDGGGTVNAAGGAQTLKLPYPTTDEGDFDVFMLLSNTTGTSGGYMTPGNETSHIQTLNMYAQGTDTGNATAYLVPSTGISIISDIDDILRVTKIWQPDQGILNTFAKPFEPWLNMPAIYANWSASIPDFHFHYLTTTPEQGTRDYMEFIYATYPLGSFDTRPLNFSDVSATLSIRKFLLDKIFQTFPKRKFILIADTSNSDVMKDYPEMATTYPDQVLCIFLRNTSATDPTDRFPYDTSGFKGLDQQKYMFFLVPDDLTHLDVVGGHCWNESIPQNVTFGYQGLPFGLGNKNAAGSVRPPSLVATWLGLMVLAVEMMWVL